jgi:hypothetical protein
MPFTSEEIYANRNYCWHKLRAEKQPSDVLHAVERAAPESGSRCRDHLPQPVALGFTLRLSGGKDERS